MTPNLDRKYVLELRLEYSGGYVRPQLLKEWLVEKLHLLRLESGEVSVLSVQTIAEEGISIKAR
jgi:hypothetical protein